jgi:phosphotransferase system  glucose/maltose/N-acetylglucosamine-specific IIC component
LIGAAVGTGGLVGVIVALICMPLSVIIIRAANSAPSHRSWLHAIVRWFLGFLAIDAAIFVAIGVAILVPLLAKQFVLAKPAGVLGFFSG